MACLVVPASAAVVVSGMRKKIPASLHPERLELLLWGGTAMLLVDHVMTGELVPFPPFLTKMQNAADAAAMVHEIATTGVLMTAFVFALWAGSLLLERILRFTRRRTRREAA